MTKTSRAARIYAWMRGQALDGGVTSADVAAEFGGSVRHASADLCKLEGWGLIACVGWQDRQGDWPQAQKAKIYVRADEVGALHAAE